MKRKALDSFETSSKQLMKLALEISTAKDHKEGVGQNTMQRLRQELIVMLDIVLRGLLRVFKM